MFEAVREQLLDLVQALRDGSDAEKPASSAQRKLSIELVDTRRGGLASQTPGGSDGDLTQGDGASEDEKSTGEGEDGGIATVTATRSPATGSNGFDWNTFAASLEPYVTLTYKPIGQRPSLAPNDHVEVAADQKKSQRLTVVACGPGQMCDRARVEALDALKKREWANVVYAEECFDW